MKDAMKKEPSLQNKRAVNIANKMGKRYTLLDAMLMGKKLKIDWKKSKFTMGDLLVGMHYELEHGKVDADTNVTNDNALKTAKIAWAHLKERPDYYVQLMKIDPPKKMEKKGSDELNDMVKEAAPRWKKEFGNLSSEARKTLRNNFVDPERYVNGLQKGNENLIKKMNVTVVPAGDKKALKKAYNHKVWDGEAVRKMYAAQGINMDEAPWLIKTIAKGAVKTFPMLARHALNKDGGPSAIAASVYTKSPVIANYDLASDVSNKKFADIAKHFVKRKSNNTDLDRRGINAMVLRHELDELRGSKNKGITINGGRHKGYYSHISPDVLHRESSNLAFMPKGTKEAFIRMRNYTGEAQDLYRGGGIRYGNSPYYNKSKANTHHIKFKNEA